MEIPFSNRPAAWSAVILVVGVALWFGCWRDTDTPRVAEGAIICFGDSITEGYTLPRQDAFPALLEKKWGRPVVNAGRSGDTTRDALARVQRDVLEKKPALVIVQFGANDYYRQIPVEETVHNMEVLLDKIQATGAVVVLAHVSEMLHMQPYAKKYKRMAQEKGIRFIPDLLDGILTDPRLKLDQVHPNALGHRIIAEKIDKFVGPLLSNLRK